MAKRAIVLAKIAEQKNPSADDLHAVQEGNRARLRNGQFCCTYRSAQAAPAAAASSSSSSSSVLSAAAEAARKEAARKALRCSRILGGSIPLKASAVKAGVF